MTQKHNPSLLARARRVFDLEIEALRQVRAQQGPPFIAAIQLMTRCLEKRGKIVVSGIGKSGLIGRKIAREGGAEALHGPALGLVVELAEHRVA